VRIKYLGHSAFLVTTNSGTKILLDPYIAGSAGLGHAKIEEAADIVVLSHEHADHGGVSAEGLPGSPKIVRGSETQTVDGIEFRALELDHDRAGTLGKVTSWNFMVDDVRIAHLGDVGRPLKTSEIIALGGRVGVMCVPVGGGAVLTPKDASAVVEKVSPRIAIPMHYATDKNSIPPSKIEDYLALKELIQHVDGSELEVRAGVLPPRYPMNTVLQPAL